PGRPGRAALAAASVACRPSLACLVSSQREVGGVEDQGDEVGGVVADGGPGPEAEEGVAGGRAGGGSATAGPPTTRTRASRWAGRKAWRHSDRHRPSTWAATVPPAAPP